MALVWCAALGLSACNRSQPTGQVVAIINDEDVTLGELRAEAAARAKLGSPAAAMPELLRAVVDRKLWAQEARRAKRDQDSQYILSRRRSDELLLADLETQALQDTIAQPSDEEIDQFLKDRPTAFMARTTFLVDQITVRPQGNALLEERFKRGTSLDEIEAMLTSMGVVGQRSKAEWTSIFMPATDAVRLASLPPTKLFFRQVGDRLVAARVVSKYAVPLSYSERKALARQSLTEEELKGLLASRLQEMRASAHIRVQPGFAIAAPQ